MIRILEGPIDPAKEEPEGKAAKDFLQSGSHKKMTAMIAVILGKPLFFFDNIEAKACDEFIYPWTAVRTVF